MSSPAPLTYELDALRQVLVRLMTEETNVESLCKHVPRITSVYANVARIQAGLESDKDKDGMDELNKALAALAAEYEEVDGEDEEDDQRAHAW